MVGMRYRTSSLVRETKRGKYMVPPPAPTTFDACCAPQSPDRPEKVREVGEGVNGLRATGYVIAYPDSDSDPDCDPDPAPNREDALRPWP